MNKRHSVYLIAAGLVTVAAVLTHKIDPLQINSFPEKSIEGAVIAPDNILPTSAALVIELPQDDLVSSLAGTHHGVNLKSRNQKLIITASLKDLFDYYLSAAGEETINDIDQRVGKELARQLQAESLVEALSIWKNYLAYKSELVIFDQQYPTYSRQPEKLTQLQLLQQRQLALIALQDQIFGADVGQILFQFDRQLDGHTLEKAELLASDLSAEQRQQRLINLAAQLPIESVLSVQRNEQQKVLLEINQQQDLNAEQKFQQRELHVGAAAASRLQALDEKRAAWNARMTEFKQQKQQLEQAGLAAEEYNISLTKLYAQYFAPAEQLRARALSSNDE